METMKKRGRKRLNDKDKVKTLSICLPLITIKDLEDLASNRCITISKVVKDIIEYSFNNNFKD